jgi:hypothetical protein
MTGEPPSARQIPTDLAEHARDYSHRYAELMDYLVSQRMLDLGIPAEQIGANDPQKAIRHAAFFPHEKTGGGNVVGGRLTVDSGVFNPELNAEKMGPEASALWAKSRLRDRIDAVISHEHAEASGIGHNEAVQKAVETPLPISDKARHMLRVIAEGEKNASRGVETHRGGSSPLP